MIITMITSIALIINYDSWLGKLISEERCGRAADAEARPS
jgi:hypothetical protein